jgi:hypothetical protein
MTIIHPASNYGVVTIVGVGLIGKATYHNAHAHATHAFNQSVNHVNQGWHQSIQPRDKCVWLSLSHWGKALLQTTWCIMGSV